MVQNHTAQNPPKQVAIDNMPETVLAELWQAYCEDASDCVLAASVPVRDETGPIQWDVSGIDHLGLRGIVRQIYKAPGRAPVDTVWIRNYPGLRAAIPERGLVRRPGYRGGDRRISDCALVREFSLTILGRGRGLRDRGRALIAELCEARCLGVRYFTRKDGVHQAPPRFTAAERAAITRNRLTSTQWRILETLAFARGNLSKLGLWGSSDEWGRVFGCTGRTIRRAMADLEQLGIAWRQYTPTDGTEGRRVDQAANMIVPGPQWMRIDGLFTGDDKAEALEHWGDVARMRSAETRRRVQYARQIRVARANGEPIPVPPGGYPLSFEEWVGERLQASAVVGSVRHRLEVLESDAREVSTEDARAISTGDATPLEAYSDGQDKRRDSRDTLAMTRRGVMEPVTVDALLRTPDAIESLRSMDAKALARVAERAADAGVKRPVYSSRRADKLSAPSQAMRVGQKGGPAHANGPRVAALRDALAKRFGVRIVKPRGWGDWGDGGDIDTTHEPPIPTQAPLRLDPTERVSKENTRSTPRPSEAIASDAAPQNRESERIASVDNAPKLGSEDMERMLRESSSFFLAPNPGPQNKRDKKS